MRDDLQHRMKSITERDSWKVLRKGRFPAATEINPNSPGRMQSLTTGMYVCTLKLRYESFLQDPVSLALVLWEGSSCLYITPKSATLHLPPSFAGKVWLWHHGSETLTNTRVGQMQTQSLPPALCNKLRLTKKMYINCIQ